MATMITAECINCGACEPECPNTAIYQGGVDYEYNGQTLPALSQEVFYIVPEKCTECVGFHDQEACAAVCPVDVCIPNPDIPESEEVLIVRAKQLHPDTDFGPNFPSRFREGGGSEVPPAAEAAPAPAAPAAPAAAPAPAPAAPAAAAPPVAGRTERPISGPKVAPASKMPRVEKTFAGELSMSFDDAVALLKIGRGKARGGVKWLAALAQPLLGALPFKIKKSLEQAIGDRRFFTAAGATGVNALQNMILYPLIITAIGALVMEREVFSAQLKWYIFLGIALASFESIWRMREGFRGLPPDRVIYRGTFYGLPIAPVVSPLVSRLNAPKELSGTVGQDGFSDQRFDEKLERERRYGEVYRLREENNGFLVEFEFPRKTPQSGVKEELGIPDEMPDYDYDLSLHNGFFVVKGKVTDPALRKAAAVSSAFPPDFTTNIKLPSRVKGFRHRFNDKNLEVALVKRV
jgi:ferredoxin